ncbi:MAG: sugar phosphate isomerase/epimerase family protein [Planctomycetota bacterium]
MRRLSIHESSSFRWSFFQDVIKYANAGYRSMGLWRTKVEDFGVDNAADLLHEMQIRASSYGWAGGFTGSSGFSFSDAVDDAILAIHQAHRLNADKLILYSGARNGHTHSHALRLVKTAIAKISPIAADMGVQILLEPVFTPKNPWDCLSFGQYLRLLENFNESELGIALDIFHFGASEANLDQLNQIAPRIQLVQIADGCFCNREFVRCNLGAGKLPIRSWMDRIQMLGYEGDIEVELHGFKFEESNYIETFEKCENYMANLSTRSQHTPATIPSISISPNR